MADSTRDPAPYLAMQFTMKDAAHPGDTLQRGVTGRQVLGADYFSSSSIPTKRVARIRHG